MEKKKKKGLYNEAGLIKSHLGGEEEENYF